MTPKIFSILRAFHFSSVFAFVFFTSSALSLDQKLEACEPKTCGLGPNISYPLWISRVQESYCGIPNFEITCYNDYPLLKISGDEYFIKKIFPNNHSVLVVSAAAYGYEAGTCPTPLHNISLDRTPFSISPGHVNLTLLYTCSTQTSVPAYLIDCASNDTSYSFATFHANLVESYNFSTKSCRYVVNTPLYIDVDDAGSLMSKNITQLLEIGFFLNWTAPNCTTCESSGGRCGYEDNNFICFCPNGPHDPEFCHHGGLRNVQLKVIIGLCAGAGVGMLFGYIFFCLRRRNSSHAFSKRFLHGEKMKNQDIEVFMKKDGSLNPTKYSYSDVKKVTNLFKEKLGQGGFGTVYKGKLPDGRLVAVKILSETEGSGEEFINEVASISRTSHVNVVSLLGFCLERRKRALIYEFMPNGSLDKFLRSKNRQNTEEHLEWEQLYEIATGVARGLEYLHRGCSTRIVHFDIKPHNILLDKDFFPKISDFGLAKLCSREKSILSMLEARGTIGYIAPEVFSRNFGGVSHKSDVYSYGMVLLDIVGEKSKDENVESDATEKYFPYWVYKHIELNKFGDLGVTAVKDIEIVRKMATVGLWCIQTNPSDRPSMSRVIEMLEGNTEILEVPPKPFLFSPARSASDSCTLSSS